MYGVATHFPSRSIRRRTLAGAASWKVTASASATPSPFGVSTAGLSAGDTRVRVIAICSWLVTLMPAASIAVSTIV